MLCSRAGSCVVPLASGQTNDSSGSLVAVAEGLLVEVLLANTESMLETTKESVVGAEEVLQLLEEAMVEERIAEDDLVIVS